MKNPRIIIIGAGPTGLGAGRRLVELGYTNFAIYEKETYVGGLASSFVDNNGFTWDLGGHVLHSHYDYFDQMFFDVMGKDYLTHEREAWVWIYDRFVPYPFQNNIHRLPPRVLEECLDGLRKLKTKKIKNLKNFQDWILHSFGSGIAKHFLLPYNRKVWAYPPDKMNYQWVGDRVATVDIDRIENNIRNKHDDVSWGPNAVFHFPKSGGTGEIWNRVSQLFKKNIHLDKELLSINENKKQVVFADGSKDFYDLLLTTIPLDLLVKKLKMSDASIDQNKLHHSSVNIVGIGVKGDVPENLRTKCWMYFPENVTPFFRATVFSNYSPYNAPKGCWSLMTEISSSGYVPLPKGNITDLTVEGAMRTSLIPKGSKIESIWSFRSDYGYPTPTLTRDSYLKNVLPKLAQKSIYSRGRFGGWKYEVSNQDHTFMQGVEWVNSIIKNEKEVTIFDPKIVNSKK